MTRFTVLWDDEATAELAKIWMDASDRSLVTNSSNKIDKELRTDPHLKGRELTDETNSIIVFPLCAIYHIDFGDRKVYVIRLARIDN